MELAEHFPKLFHLGIGLLYQNRHTICTFSRLVGIYRSCFGIDSGCFGTYGSCSGIFRCLFRVNNNCFGISGSLFCHFRYLPGNVYTANGFRNQMRQCRYFVSGLYFVVIIDGSVNKNPECSTGNQMVVRTI